MGGSNSFRVDPQHVKALRDEIHSVQQEITKFIMQNGPQMVLQKQAADPVSEDAAKAFSANAQAAIQEANKFAANLKQLVDSLDGAHKAYTTNDADGATTFAGS